MNLVRRRHAPSGSANPGLDAVCAALAELGLRAQNIEQELEGGASTRQFFRLNLDGQPAVAMFTPAPSQEIVKAQQSSGYASFVEVARLLSECEVPVPKILHASLAHPVLFVEDLGDYTLANYLGAHPERKDALYQKAIVVLAEAKNKLDPLPEGSVIRNRAFDHDLLLWEVEHFEEWALAARGIDLSPEQSEVFQAAARFLAETISSWPRGFVHRDYQSRNLMILGPLGEERVTWIDFQDAMMGPRVYDLVALLTDSYQTFSQDFVETRLDEYCALRGLSDERVALGLEFSLVTVQRKLKDAGRFVFLDRVNKNGHFLQFVDSTIAKARSALTEVRHLGPLGKLDDLLSELFGPVG